MVTKDQSENAQKFLPNTGYSGQRLCRSKTGAVCQKWHENDMSLASPAAAAEPFR